MNEEKKIWEDELKKKSILRFDRENFAVNVVILSEVIPIIDSLLKHQREICAELLIDTDIKDFALKFQKIYDKILNLR